MSSGEKTKEMVWKTGAFAAFAEDLGLILSACMVIYPHPSIQYQVIWHSLLISVGTAFRWCAYMHMKVKLMHIKFEKLF